MLEQKEIEKVLKKFKEAYTLWLDSYGDCLAGKEKALKREREHSAPGSVAIYPEWKRLHDIEKAAGKELQYKAKDLLLMLSVKNFFGEDVLDDYRLKCKWEEVK